MYAKTLFLALAFLLTATFSFAGNGEQVFRKRVSKQIKYPELKGEKVETEVYVQFTVSESGEIVIDKIDSASDEINEAIAQQIKDLKVDATDSEVIGKTFYYRFLLKVQ
jgi:hypothetical protein